MILFISLLFFGSIKESHLPREIEARIQIPGTDTGFWGIQVFAPLREKMLFEKNATRYFRPASNMKVVSTLLAFEHLGANYIFHTSFYARGTIENGVLYGDLIVMGHGDPSISGNYQGVGLKTQDFLDEIIEKVQLAGITRIEGRLIASTGFFDDVHIQKSWEWDDLGENYATPITDLSMHDGWIDVTLKTDREGNPSVSYEPVWTPDVEISVNLFDSTPTAAGYKRILGSGKVELKVKRTWGTNHFQITGPKLACMVKTLHFSAWDPTKQFLEVFKGSLQENGIAVKGQSEIQHGTPSGRFLFNHYSASLAEVSKVLMKRSQNHYADSFLKTTARIMTGEGSFENGEELARNLIIKAGEVTSVHLDLTGFNMVEGSGLSAQNYLQPAYLVALLNYALEQDYKNSWLASFPVMGQDGTLKNRGVESQGKQGVVIAKTGYIYRARCLSGYIKTNSGEPLVFSMLVNNYGCKTRQINEIQDKICDLLMNLKPSFSVKRKLTLLQKGQSLPQRP